MLTERIRNVLTAQGVDFAEKKMFGGAAFMIRDKMSVGVTNKQMLMLRVRKTRADEVLELPHAKPMDFNGRVMQAFIFVEPAGFESDSDLEKWVGYGIEYGLSDEAPASKKKKA